MSAPVYQHVDPSTINLPADNSEVLNTLNQIKNVLLVMNQNLGLAIGHIASDQANIQTLENQGNVHDQHLSNLETLMIAAQANIQRLVTATGATGTSTGGSKKPKLSEPAKFDGTDKTKAVSFRVAVSHYLRVSYPGSTVDEQIAFIISCLDGKAHEWLDPYLEEDEVKGNPVSWLHSLDDFWSQFNARWNVQNRSENFRAKLRTLKQTKSVQEYFKDFQLYSQGLGYNDVSLRDMFYDGLSLKIKEMLMAQDFDHSAATVSLQTLAEKSLKIDQRLEQFASQNKHASTSSQPSTKSGASPSTAVPREVPGGKLTVGEHVYQLGSDGKARKGTIQSISGKNIPTILWNDGTSGESSFKKIKRDNHPITVPISNPPPPSSSKGPGPMDVDAAGKSKQPLVCSNCGGRGHFAKNCPSKSYSGQGAHISDDEDSEKEDL
jgi:hypothetical protein